MPKKLRETTTGKRNAEDENWIEEMATTGKGKGVNRHKIKGALAKRYMRYHLKWLYSKEVNFAWKSIWVAIKIEMTQTVQVPIMNWR